MTKYDYLAIAVLIALMVWKAAEKFPQLRLSAWGGIVSFFALAIAALFYVKWSPYYATALAAAQDHTLGESIVSGDLPAAPPRSATKSRRFIRSPRRRAQVTMAGW